MERTTENRLEAIEQAVARLEGAVEMLGFYLRPMVAAWERFGPELERRLDNRVTKWKAGRRPAAREPGPPHDG